VGVLGATWQFHCWPIGISEWRTEAQAVDQVGVGEMQMPTRPAPLAFDKGQQIRIDDVRVGRTHAVRQARVNFQTCIGHELR
jgi:hypothetical protein